jgi:hypothetical protein
LVYLRENRSAEVDKGVIPQDVRDFKALIGKEDSQVKNQIVEKIEEFVKVAKEDHSLLVFLLQNSAELDIPLKIKMLELLRSEFSKQSDLKKFMNRVVLIKSAKELSSFQVYSSIANNLSLNKDRLKAQACNNKPEFNELKAIFDKLKADSDKDLVEQCPVKDLVDEKLESSIDIFLYKAVKSNLRKKYAKTSALYHYLNHSLDIYIQLFSIIDFGNTSRKYNSTLRDDSLTEMLKYLEILSIGNHAFKSSTIDQVNLIIRDLPGTTDGQMHFLLFLRQWIFENEELLKDQALVKEYCTVLLDILQSQHGMGSSIAILVLDIIPLLTTLKEAPIIENQNIVLSLMFELKYSNCFSKIAGQKLSRFIEEHLKKRGGFSNIVTVGKTKLSISDPELRFIQFYLRALNSCTQGENAFTENFCQKLYSPSLLHFVLREKGLNVDIKHAIVEYILETYLKAEKIISEHSIYIFESLFEFLIVEFEVGIKTLLDQSEDYTDLQDVIIVQEHECDVYNHIVENYLFKLADIFETLVAMNIPELKFDNLAEIFQRNLDRILVLLDQNIAKMSISCRKRFSQLVINISKTPHDDISVKQIASAKTLFNKHCIATEPLQSIFAKNKDNKAREDKEAGMVLQPIIKFITDIIDDQLKTSSPESRFQYLCQDLLSAPKDEDKKSIDSIAACLVESLTKDEQIETLSPELYHLCIKMLQFYLSNIEDDNELLRRQNQLISQRVIPNVGKIFCCVKSSKLQDECVDLIILLLENGNKNGQTDIKGLEETVDDTSKVDSFMQTINKMLHSSVSQLTVLCKRGRQHKLQTLFLQNKIENINFSMLQEAIAKKKLCEGIKDLFRMLQLCCEGHNADLQGLVLGQGRGSRDANFLFISVSLIGNFIKYLDPDVGEMLFQVQDFLIEALQGPKKENQDYIFKSKFLDFMNDYLLELEICSKSPEENFDKLQILEKIIKKSVGVVNSALEGNSGDKDLLSKVDKHVHVPALMHLLAREFEAYSKELASEGKTLANLGREQTFNEKITEMFQTYFFLKSIADNLKEEYEGFFSSGDASEQEAIKFFEKNSSKIEVVFLNKLERIYFIIQPASSLLSQEEKNNFLDTVKRDSLNNKLSDLLLHSKRLLILMDYNHHTMHTAAWYIRLSRRVYSKINQLFTFCVFIFSIIMFFTDNYGSEGFISLRDDNPIFSVSRYLLLLLSFVRIFAFSVFVAPLAIVEGWNKIFIQFRKEFESRVDCYLIQKEIIDSPGEQAQNEKFIHLLSQDVRTLDYNTRISIITYLREAEGYRVGLPRIYYLMKNLNIIMNDTEFIYFIYCTLLIILSIIYKMDFFIAFLLLDIIVASDNSE